MNLEYSGACEFEQVVDVETLGGWVVSHLADAPKDFAPFWAEVIQLHEEGLNAGMSSVMRDKGKWRWKPDPKIYNANFIWFALRPENVDDTPLSSRHWVFLMDDAGLEIQKISLLTPEQIAAIQWTD